jgi:glycine/D-amino acid oxidase-like deaminating enzyme
MDHVTRALAWLLCVVLGSGERIVTETFVNAAGPFLGEVAEMVGCSLPVMHEVHLKASIADIARVVDRDAPLLIDTDPQRLDWTEDERAALAEEGWDWLLEELPSGAHVRPEGGALADTIIMLWDARTHLSQPVLPVPLDPLYPEVAVRGLCKMLPGMKAYRKSMPKPYLDGGYYTRTEENRPLCSPMPLAGSYVIGAMSGFGIMSAPALGELLAGHICGSIMPGYAWQFELSRYDDPTYQEMLADWGDSWQL